MTCYIVVAASQNGVIGKNGHLPWRLPADMKFFRELTTGHTVIMGRKTYESIGKPLVNRVNVVITRNPSFLAKSCLIAKDLPSALSAGNQEGKLFVIGGAEIYKQALESGMVEQIYLTVVESDFEGDAFFPVRPPGWECISSTAFPADEKNLFPYRFEILSKMK